MLLKEVTFVYQAVIRTRETGRSSRHYRSAGEASAVTVGELVLQALLAGCRDGFPVDLVINLRSDSSPAQVSDRQASVDERPHAYTLTVRVAADETIAG
jgi:hypothetical protein